MIKFKNDLGWYFNKTRSGLEIRRKYPSKKSLRNRIIKMTLFWTITAIFCFIGVKLKHGSPPEGAISIIIPLFLIIAIIFIFLSKFWLLRILFINCKSCSLITNSVRIDKQDQRLPCYFFKVEIKHTQENDLYQVYLRPSEFLEIEGPSQDWNPLVWQSHSADEANQIFEILQDCGIGETDPEKQHPIFRRNKKAGVLLLIVWIICLAAIILYLFTKRPVFNDSSNPEQIIHILHAMNILIVFGLLSFILYAVYKLWFGLQVIKHRQIPPPGSIVFVDTIGFKGDKAIKKGRFIVTFASVLIILSLISIIYIPYKLNNVFTPQNTQETAISGEQNEYNTSD